MKRLALLSFTALLLICTCTLSGCIIIPLHHNFKIDASTVESIEIYDLCESDSFSDRFLETDTPVYELPQDEISDFLADLEKIDFSDSLVITIAAIDPSFYYDVWTVRINYTDGSYELLSCDGYGATYHESGEIIDGHHWGCDDDEWLAFMGQYVPENIFEHAHQTE